FAPGTGTINVAGATAKSITNNGTLEFTNLEIANTTGNDVTTSTGFTVTGGNFNIGTNASFIADAGTVTFGPLAVAFDNISDQAAKAVFFGLEFEGAVTHTIAAGNQISIKENMTFGDAVTVTHTSNATSRITFNGAGPQDIVVGDGITVNLENV